MCLYEAQISVERLQDHWSSGLYNAVGFHYFLVLVYPEFLGRAIYEEGFDQLAIVINFRVCGGNVEFLSQGDALSNTTYGEK